jgi:hypothetical protein
VNEIDVVQLRFFGTHREVLSLVWRSSSVPA